MSSNVFNEMKRFQTERNLDSMKFNVTNECTSIVEELCEGMGFNVPKDNRRMLKQAWLSFIADLHSKHIIEPATNRHSMYEDVDFLNDIVQFCNGGLMKQGYDIELTLKENSKEINSRSGRITTDGKFEKFKSNEDGYTEPYKADYSKCKLKGE